MFFYLWLFYADNVIVNLGLHFLPSFKTTGSLTNFVIHIWVNKLSFFLYISQRLIILPHWGGEHIPLQWVTVEPLKGLQVNGWRVDRDFTKSLIIRDFVDVLKNPFSYVDLFLLHT